jgi:hypothetical protein
MWVAAQTEKTFNEIIQLITAIARLLWPVVIIMIVMMFRRDIRTLASRLRKGKFLGQELELAEQTQQLEQHVAAAERAQAPTPLIDPAKDRNTQLSELRIADDKVRRFLEEAASDKLLALVRIWTEIEQELRAIVAAYGFLQFIRGPNVTQYVRVLVQKKVISKETADSIERFYELRNRLLHGNLREGYWEPGLVALIDSALRLLDILKSIPRETYTVLFLVPFFSDNLATQEVEGAHAVLLDASSQEGNHRSVAYPTTKEYEIGQVVSWEWNLKKVWGSAWYREPQTGAIKHGWDSAAEFVGRPLETIK